jgi:hypothetical protein
MATQASDQADLGLSPPSKALLGQLNKPGLEKSEGYGLLEANSINPVVPEEEENGKPGNELASSGSDKTAATKPALPSKKKRYYSQNLTEEDKNALTVGELNHNLKEWTPNDLVRFQEGRLDLVHAGLENREEWLALRQMEMQKSQEYVTQHRKREEEVRRYLRVPTFTITAPERPAANKLQLQKSGPLLRVPSSQVSSVASRKVGSPHSQAAEMSNVPPVSQVSEVSSQERPALPPVEVNTQADARSGGSSSARPRRRPGSYGFHDRGLQPPRPISGPLNGFGLETPPHEPRPDITFDSFLAPHISGKGEAFRGADNAKKEDPTEDVGDGTKLVKSGGSRKNPVRRLSKMASMPSLRAHKTRQDYGNNPE